VKLVPAVGKVFQENRDIVVGVLSRVAASAGAEQYDALDPVTVERVHGSAEGWDHRSSFRAPEAPNSIVVATHRSAHGGVKLPGDPKREKSI